jgi:peptidoglycan/xylan/chitin deacetylase (PgdA/CDA1 family)
MMRRLAKSCFASLYAWSGTGRWVRRNAYRNEPFIVGYHRVVENFEHSSRSSIPSMLISSAMFEQHIDCLARHFEFVSLDEIGAHLLSATPFRRPCAAITFDDGYSDVYRNAFPILKRKGIPAAVFVVTGLVGTDRIPIHDRLYWILSEAQRRGISPERLVSHLVTSSGSRVPAVKSSSLDTPFAAMAFILNRLTHDEIDGIVGSLQHRFPIGRSVLQEMAPLRWGMIREMHRNGITIGSHTRSHTLLTQEKIMRAGFELADSRRELEARLEAPVQHFAYPDGRFTPSVVEAVRDAGYRYGYGICQARDPRFPMLTIPRKILWERACLNVFDKFSSAIMECQINGVFDRRDPCDHVHVKEGTDPRTKAGRMDSAMPSPAQREV